MKRRHPFIRRGLIALTPAVLSLALVSFEAQAQQINPAADSNTAQTMTPLQGLDRPELSSLRADILEQFARNPESFRDFQAIKAQVIAADRTKRGRLAHVAPHFRALGPEGLLPMLHALATESGRGSGMMPRAWTAYRGGMLEAVGTLRDARAVPVLQAVLEGTETNPVIVRAAAEALGKIGDDDTIKVLIGLAKQPGPKQESIMGGLGSARRMAVAEFLAAELVTGEPSMRSVVARALGQVGNSWAWQTPVVSASGEGDDVRRLAVSALVEAFAASLADENLRREITRAILLVDHDQTPILVQQAQKDSSPDTRAALDALLTRFEKSPLRR